MSVTMANERNKRINNINTAGQWPIYYSAKAMAMAIHQYQAENTILNIFNLNGTSKKRNGESQ